MSFCWILRKGDAHFSMFYQRIGDEYAGQKNYYALAYNQDEVIDSVSCSGRDS